MTPDQIAEAQKLAREWVEEHGIKLHMRWREENS